MSNPAIGATKLFALPSPVDKKSGTVEKLTSPLKLRPPEPLYIAGADLDFSWYEWQIQALKEDYGAGLPVMDIAYRLNRDYREVLYMIIDQAHFGKLEARAGGVF